MSTEAGAAAAPAAEPAAPSAEERGLELIAKHVASTEAALLDEKDAEQAEAEEKPEEAPKGKQRGADGKFLKAGEKPAPAEPVKPGEKPVEKAPEVVGGIGKAQRLVREGKIADALNLIGLDPEKLDGPKWAAWRHENKKASASIGESRQQVEQQAGQVQQFAQQLVRDFQPMIHAKQAWANEDYDAAMQLAFGVDLNTFQRRALASMANPGAGKDPAVVATRQELYALKQELARRDQAAAAQYQQATVDGTRQEYWNNLTSELKGADDVRISKAAERELFVREVFAIQKQHYDPQSDSTLPALEAAELAYERMHGEFAEWEDVFGGGSSTDAKRDRGAKTPAATGPGGIQVRRAQKPTSLNPSQAAEASPAVKLKGKALMDFYVRKTQEAMRNGSSG